MKPKLDLFTVGPQVTNNSFLDSVCDPNLFFPIEIQLKHYLFQPHGTYIC